MSASELYSGPNFVNFNPSLGDFARHCAHYENFNIKPSAYYDLDRVTAAGHLHVITAFGQGILLNCEMSSRMAQVRLADTGDIIPLPAGQITLHEKHKIPTFAEFMAGRRAQREEQTMNNAGMNSMGMNVNNSGGLKRERPADSASTSFFADSASTSFFQVQSSSRSSGSSCDSGSCTSGSPEETKASSSCEESYDSMYNIASAAHARGLHRPAPNQFNFQQ